MAQKVVTERFDDLDGSPAVETVRFGYAGREYEIDLNEEHAAELDEALVPYVEHARRADGGVARQRRGRRSESERRSPEELRAIRQWAGDQGLQVSDRGRISADIVASTTRRTRSPSWAPFFLLPSSPGRPSQEKSLLPESVGQGWPQATRRAWP